MTSICIDVQSRSRPSSPVPRSPLVTAARRLPRSCTTQRHETLRTYMSTVVLDCIRRAKAQRSSHLGLCLLESLAREACLIQGAASTAAPLSRMMIDTNDAVQQRLTPEEVASADLVRLDQSIIHQSLKSKHEAFIASMKADGHEPSSRLLS